MASGDKEVLQAFEETITRNVKTAVAHGNETRNIVRQLEAKVQLLEGLLGQYDQKLALLQTQLTNVQAKLYASGTV